MCVLETAVLMQVISVVWEVSELELQGFILLKNS